MGGPQLTLSPYADEEKPLGGTLRKGESSPGGGCKPEASLVGAAHSEAIIRAALLMGAGLAGQAQRCNYQAVGSQGPSSQSSPGTEPRGWSLGSDPGKAETQDRATKLTGGVQGGDHSDVGWGTLP